MSTDIYGTASEPYLSFVLSPLSANPLRAAAALRPFLLITLLLLLLVILIPRCRDDPSRRFLSALCPCASVVCSCRRFSPPRHRGTEIKEKTASPRNPWSG